MSRAAALRQLLIPLARHCIQPRFRHVHQHALGELLEVLVTLDAIVLDNPAIGTAWENYKRMMQYVRARPDEFALGAPEGERAHLALGPHGERRAAVAVFK